MAEQLITFISPENLQFIASSLVSMAIALRVENKIADIFQIELPLQNVPFVKKAKKSPLTDRIKKEAFERGLTSTQVVAQNARESADDRARDYGRS